MGRVAVLVAAGLFLVAVFAPTRPARADTAYRYWAFYVAHAGTWQFSQRGPASEYPVDGEVQGWRFAVQAEAAHGLPPRAAPDFATLCAATPAAAGEIRVGIVLDFGTVADEPAHERPPASVVPGCVRVHAGDSGAAVLEAAAQVRIGTAGADAGLVCGLDGYPRSECAPAVTTPATPSPSARTAATTTAPAPATTATAGASTAAAVPGSSSATTPSAPVSVPASGTGVDASPAAPPVSAVALASPVEIAATTLKAARAAAPKGRGFSVTTAVGIALVVALAFGALWRSRGRRR